MFHGGYVRLHPARIRSAGDHVTSTICNVRGAAGSELYTSKLLERIVGILSCGTADRSAKPGTQ